MLPMRHFQALGTVSTNTRTGLPGRRARPTVADTVDQTWEDYVRADAVLACRPRCHDLIDSTIV
jgi:hypothetical protein